MIFRILRACAIALPLALGACFGPGTPEEQVQVIEEMLASKIPMTDKQKSDFDAHYTKGKEALAAGKKDEAGAELGKAFDIIKYAQDAALINKSD